MIAIKPTLSLILGIATGITLVSYNALATPSLGSPAPLKATLDSTNPMKVMLTWANIPGETGYIVEREAGTSTSFTEVAKLGPDATAYGDITTTSQTYVYRVRAYKVMGAKLIYSTYTNIVSVWTAAPAPTGSTTSGTTSSSGTTTDTACP